MNFHQWRQHADRGEIKRITWCCGDEPVLVEEVVDRLRHALRPGEMDSVTLHAGTVADRVIWDAAHQYPIQPDVARLVTVRHADQIVQWHPLHIWLDRKRLNPMTYLLFVSHTSTASAAEHISLIRRSGHVVECRRPSEAELVAWTQSIAPLSDGTARYLAQRCAGALHQVRSVSAKLALFEGTPGPQTVDELCDATPAEQFSDAVMLLKGPVAHSLISSLPSTEYRRVIGQLDSRLTVVARLRDAVAAKMTRRDMAMLPDLPFSLAERFLPVVDQYQEPQCRYRREVLATLDIALAGGAYEGVLESLVTLWTL